jgi:predicted hydrocarbon binding protein
MQFKEFEAGIEVSGESLGAIVDGFKKYPSIASKYLSKFGLARADGGRALAVDRTRWYSLKDWLSAYEGIAQEIGYNSLYSIGKSIPENAVFPPHITDIFGAIDSIDVAYHLNHRKNGTVMFNPENGSMLEGIGHYRASRVANDNKIVCVCENPYPCDFDRGIISAMANRFEKQARTVHDAEAPCRKKGADSCSYVIWW